jgi:hypothetical protein
MTAKEKNNFSDTPWVNWFVGGVIIAAVLLAMRALAAMSDENALIYRLSSAGWGKLAEVILKNKINALWHAALMVSAAGLCLWLFCRTKLKNRYVFFAAQWLLVAVVAGDAFWLSRHYIKTMPVSAFAENDVIRLIKSGMPERRVYLVSQEGFYNHWLTFLFPYHCIKTINVTQMPRMPADYQKFFGALHASPLRFWQLSAVGFVLAPAQAWAQFQNDPAMKDAFELVYAYNVKAADFSVEVVPATAEQPGQHVIMRLIKPAPRFSMHGKWEVVNDNDVLRRLSSTNYPLFEKIMIAPAFARNIPAAGDVADEGQVQLLEYKPGRVKLRTSSVTPAVLRFSERYDPDWIALVDGKEAKVLRTDFIFQGVYLNPGMHEVLFEYSPSKTLLWFQALGFLIVAAAAVILIIRRNK